MNLLLQFSNDDFKTGVEIVQSSPVSSLYDKYRKQQVSYYDIIFGLTEGFYRSPKTWEPVLWQAYLRGMLNIPLDSVILPATEVPDLSKYAVVFGSVMEWNKDLFRETVASNISHFVLGHYTKRTKEYFERTFRRHTENYLDIWDYARKNGMSRGSFTPKYTKEDQKCIPRLQFGVGCDNNCSFCVVPKGYTSLDNNWVDKQIESFHDLTFRYVYVDDKTVTQNQEPRLYRAFNEIRKSNKDFKGFIIQTTVPNVISGIGAFENCGVKYIETGVEIMDDAVLNKFRKPTTIKQNWRLAEVAVLRSGVKVVPNVMVGIPEADYQETMDYVFQTMPVFAYFNQYNFTNYDSRVSGDSDERKTAKSWGDSSSLVREFDDVFVRGFLRNWSEKGSAG